MSWRNVVFSTMVCLMAFAFLVKFRVDLFSPINNSDGLRVMIKLVNELQPRLSFMIWVSLQSRYGTCCRFLAFPYGVFWEVLSLGSLRDERLPKEDFLLRLVGGSSSFSFPYRRRAATTLQRVDKELLMCLDSSILSWQTSVSEMRSLPARSTRLNLETSFYSISGLLIRLEKTLSGKSSCFKYILI